jgi:hypothetical protein
MQSLVRLIDKACGFAYRDLPEGTDMLQSVFQNGPISSQKMTSAMEYEPEQVTEKFV